MHAMLMLSDSYDLGSGLGCFETEDHRFRRANVIFHNVLEIINKRMCLMAWYLHKI